MKTPGAIVLGLASVLFFAASAGAAIKPSPWPWFPEEPQGYYTQIWHDGFRAGEIAANQDMTEKIEALPQAEKRQAAVSQTGKEQAGLAYGEIAEILHVVPVGP